MLTWRIWHALCHPPEQHPLFIRTLKMPSPVGPLMRTVRVTVLYLAACLVFTFIWPVLLVNAPVVLLVTVAASNTIYSMICAARISAAVAREREQQTYDLLCLLPGGALGTGWALSTAYLHRSRVFRLLQLMMPILIVALTCALLIAMLIPALMILTPGSAATFGLFLLLDYGLTLALAFYLDHIQSVTLAHLIAMIAAAYAGSRLNAQLWAAAGLLLLQLLTYLLTLIAGFVIVPAAISDQQSSAPLIIIMLPILRLAFFYLLREVTLWAAWHMMIRQYNATSNELDTMLRHTA